MIEFKNENVFIEYHYNSQCSLIPYYGSYINEGDLLEINGEDRVILELTSEILTLYNPITDTTQTYTRI